MLTSTHAQMEVWVEILTLVIPIGAGVGGLAVKGWIKALRMEKDAIVLELTKLRGDDEMQWGKIHDLEYNDQKFVTLDRHESLRKEMAEMLEKAVRPVIDGQIRLEAKIDRVIEGHLK